MNKIIFLSRINLAAIFVFTIFSAMQLNADGRYFGQSYLAFTPPARELELEIWQSSRIGKASGMFFTWQPQIEMEYGVTDRFVTSLYLNFISEKAEDNNFQSKSLSVSAASIELRYRLSEPNEFVIDPAAYFEFVYSNDRISYEPKLLLSKRMGNFISAINIGSEFEKSRGEDEIETEFVLSAGTAYDVTQNFSVGLELRNNIAFSGFYESQNNRALFIGPTLSYKLDELNFVLNAMAQIHGSPATKNNLELISHEKFEVRFVVGLEL